MKKLVWKTAATLLFFPSALAAVVAVKLAEIYDKAEDNAEQAG